MRHGLEFELGSKCKYDVEELSLMREDESLNHLEIGIVYDAHI